MTKRKDHEPISDNAPYAKRYRSFDGGVDDDIPRIQPSVQPRVNPTYGQRGAFPGLDDDPDDEKVFYGPASDGLEYLQMVRSEAKGVPNLLVAPISPTAPSTDLYADYVQGYYSDGAYTAVPSTIDQSAVRNSEADEDLDPQEAYYALLCSRFRDLSATLQSSPPENILSPSSQESASSLNCLSRTNWERHIFYMEPSMALLSQLRQESIIYGLRILEKSLTKRNLQKFYNLGVWAWGLLARCREVGQMGSEEVGVLRDLGKKASWIIRGIRAGMEESEEQIDDIKVEEDDHGETGEEIAIEEHETSRLPKSDSTEPEMVLPNPDLPTTTSPLPAHPNLLEAQQRLLTSFISSSTPTPTPAPSNLPPSNNTTNNHPPPTNPTNPILDMLVTVIGEFYGQRDLLGGRWLWDECVG